MNGQQQAAKLIDQAGLTDVLSHIHQAIGLASQAISQVEAHERAQALGIDTGDFELTHAGANMRAAGRAASQAALLVTRHRATPQHAEFLRQFEHVKSQAPASLNDAHALFLAGLHRTHISAADAQEIKGMWDEPAGRMTGDGGINSLYTFLEQQLSSFATEADPERNFGRDPHSPLQTWQWILIGVLIGVAVAAVIACLIWGGCSWIAYIFVATFCITGSVANPTISALCAGFAF
jgi:hypothetical protein